MTQAQDDIKANSERRAEMLTTTEELKTRFTDEKTALDSASDGTGIARKADMAKRTKREIKADLDDILKCQLKFEQEASVCRTAALKLVKDLERRG